MDKAEMNTRKYSTAVTAKHVLKIKDIRSGKFLYL